MVKICKEYFPESEGFYMDGYMKSNLDIAKKVIKKDWDMLFVYDGSEGSGKSVKAMQDAFYCDPTLTNKRIVFTPEQFKKVLMKAKPYQAVVYDEAYTGLSSRATMSMINRTLISMLAEIRQKNLFVFVVMPCFFDLDKYVTLWRSRALIHVYTSKNFKRGYFSFYNVDRKKELFVLGKKYYSYSKPKPNFIGRFTNFYTVDEKEYRKHKRNSLVAREEIDERKKIFVRLFQFDGKLTTYEKAKLLGMTQPTYCSWSRQYKKGMLEGIPSEMAFNKTTKQIS
tara:strand:+ start:1742 stop:2587 length:846 start_codon:yes stop_codon:yes gene_type:complete